MRVYCLVTRHCHWSPTRAMSAYLLSLSSCVAEPTDSMLRSLILTKYMLAGHQPTIDECLRKFDSHVTGSTPLDADLRLPVCYLYFTCHLPLCHSPSLTPPLSLFILLYLSHSSSPSLTPPWSHSSLPTLPLCPCVHCLLSCCSELCPHVTAGLCCRC